MTWVEMVRAFHEKHGQPVETTPRLIGAQRTALRIGLIAEEAAETTEAMEQGACYGHENRAAHLAEIADGLGDTIFVCIGTALEYGIDIDRVMREIARSNMTKIKGVERDDGKILKGPDFEPPRIREIIEEDMKR